jgi:CubicO group peptidase (beta-lactamase class C family)
VSKPLVAAVSLLLLSLAPRADAQGPRPPELAGLDAQVDSVRDTFKVPGIAVAVVKDGELVFAGGWGEREVGKPGKVSALILLKTGL